MECAIWRPDATSYVVRVAGEDVRFPRTGEDLDTARAYYPSELAAMLAEAIEDAAPGSITECSASVDADTGILTLTFDAAGVIAWTHANTTLDSVYTFGFDVSADTGSATSHAGDLAMPGYWIPRHRPDDPADRADVVHAVAESLSGITRGQFFANSRRKRDLVWRHLLPSEVLDDEAADANNVFDYVWANAIAIGRKFRVYDAASGYREYQMRPDSPQEPYARNGTRAYFWDVTVLARRTTAPGVDGSEEAVPVIESFTVDAGSSATVRAGASVTFGWSVTGADTVEIDGGVGAVTPAASGTHGHTSVEGATVYTLTATNGAGSVTAQVTVTGVRQVITRYTWFRSYYSSDLSGTDLPAREAGFDLLTAKGSNATTGVTTAGLASLALPAALVNAAVEPATATSTEGYGDSSTAGNGNQFPTSTSRWHSRLLVRPTNLTNARFFWQMYFNGSNFVSVLYVSSGDTLRVSGSRTAGGFTADSAGALSNDTWHIIDITYSNNEGPSAQAELRVYVNGALTATWNGAAGAFASFDATTTLFGLMGTRTGLTTQQGRYSFWGVRSLDSINDFTLAIHQDDARELGLYTPP